MTALAAGVASRCVIVRRGRGLPAPHWPLRDTRAVQRPIGNSKASRAAGPHRRTAICSRGARLTCAALNQGLIPPSFPHHETACYERIRSRSTPWTPCGKAVIDGRRLPRHLYRSCGRHHRRGANILTEPVGSGRRDPRASLFVEEMNPLASRPRQRLDASTRHSGTYRSQLHTLFRRGPELDGLRLRLRPTPATRPIYRQLSRYSSPSRCARHGALTLGGALQAAKEWLRGGSANLSDLSVVRRAQALAERPPGADFAHSNGACVRLPDHRERSRNPRQSAEPVCRRGAESWSSRSAPACWVRPIS